MDLEAFENLNGLVMEESAYSGCDTKNVLQLLYIIAHEMIVSNSVSEYTHNPWKVSDHEKINILKQNFLFRVWP